MAPFYLSVNEAIYGGDAFTVIHSGDHYLLQHYLSGKVIAVDAASVAGFGSGKSVADLCRTIGKRCAALMLEDATPVLVVDGRFQPLGAGKSAKARARAERAQVTLPGAHTLAYYAPRSPWRDRYLLQAPGGASFAELCRAVKRYGEEMGLHVIMCDDDESAAEGVAAAVTRPLALSGGGRDAPAADMVFTTDVDALAYDAAHAANFKQDERDRKKATRCWWEIRSIVGLCVEIKYQASHAADGILPSQQHLLDGLEHGVLARFGFHSVDDLRALQWLLGVGDDAPVEALLPAGFRAERADALMDKIKGGTATTAEKRELRSITCFRKNQVNSYIQFIARLSVKARGAGLAGALAAIIHLVDCDGNDRSVCGNRDYDRYLAPILGGVRSHGRRAIKYFLEKYDDEMKNGGRRALCGRNADEQAIVAERARVRNATLPADFLNASSDDAMFDWLNGKFGGLGYASGDDHYDEIMEKIKKLRAKHAAGAS